MKALKVLVIAMALLLVGGLGLLGYGVATRVSAPKTAPAAAAVRDFGAVEVAVPAGARIEQMAVAGERVVLRLGGGGSEQVIVLDPAAGRVAGAFQLVPAVPPGR